MNLGLNSTSGVVNRPGSSLVQRHRPIPASFRAERAAAPAAREITAPAAGTAVVAAID